MIKYKKKLMVELIRNYMINKDHIINNIKKVKIKRVANKMIKASITRHHSLVCIIVHLETENNIRNEILYILNLLR
jgi:hypothetical protein